MDKRCAQSSIVQQNLIFLFEKQKEMTKIYKTWHSCYKLKKSSHNLKSLFITSTLAHNNFNSFYWCDKHRMPNELIAVTAVEHLKLILNSIIGYGELGVLSPC